MKLKKDIYDKIIMECPVSPIEVGGILGGISNVITCYFSDDGKNEYGKYTPNTKIINKIIYNWSKAGIDFLGIYHTHYPKEEKLSEADIEYIKKIMMVVYPIYKYLYFPIVIPQTSMVVYKAVMKNGKICIENEELIMID